MATETTCRPAASHDGKIIAFPSATGTANVERCARELGRRHGADAIEFWKTECRRLADQLLAAGMPESDVGQRVMEFQQDVQIELVLSHQKQAVAKSRKR
ncbi:MULTISPECIES: DUF6074 family protein [Rhizobium]|uniref:DUF6074 family protein n=1 Tax=Rhizobium TaxID=379 RepID=UPI0007E93F96|nr:MULTISPECIES: DUF6074 family protein [Rhizobium]ANK85446.1 hypothetical protein AMK02_CH01845 [Rhizobium sp. N731]ANK91322.1 hypothetical protein AMK01_CH01848 [Rhizobium sp. N6212]ANK97355.1 hypothetical protein AMK00_CH01850 [Rhizobium sp. N621]ANL03475.1 hypothetical protein AMJ99_CH01918 [Rhizobium esperanzae]ANL09520.1 hypothetical protein AMJ98_CH01839 [Rhizobium sp. N1341]